MNTSPSIVTLPCGCLFRSRVLVTGDDCLEHTSERAEFSFDELSPRAKEQARDNYREIALDHDWWDSTYEDADTIAAFMGIEIKRKHHTTYGGQIITGPQIWFSGFSSQGDGACFEGNWYPAKDPLAALNAVMSHAPDDTRLHEIAFALADMSERCNAAAPNVYVHVEQTGNLCHARAARIDVDIPTPETLDEDNQLQVMTYNAILRRYGLVYEDFAHEIREALRAFMDWIYVQLRAEHDYLTSDEAVDAALADFTFDEDGNTVG